MVTVLLEKAQQQIYKSPKEFMHEILYRVYPDLFERINGIMSATRLLQSTPRTRLLIPIAEKISHEMEELYRSEKEVLFPFITRLAEENEKSDSCRLFKDSKVHYAALLKCINELKISLNTCNEAEDDPMLPSALVDSLQAFEQQHIVLQVTKDKHLFARFKSCSGCRTLT